MSRPKQSPILVSDILPIDNPGEYKVHFATRNTENTEPLDRFLKGWKKWRKWNSWNNKRRNDFNRGRIFSLLRVYPRRDRHIWLFGGIFEVLDRFPDIDDGGYDIRESALFAAYIGRLLIEYKRPGRGRAVNFENHYKRMIVSQILESDYNVPIMPRHL